MKCSARYLGLLASATLSIPMLAGCSFLVPIEKQNYQPATGTVAELGSLDLENMIIASSGKDAPGQLIGVIVNPTPDQADVKLDVTTGDTTILTTDVTVPANSQVELNDTKDVEAVFDTTYAIPGSVVTMTATSAGQTVEFAVPVLNAETPYLKTLVPSPKSSPPSGAPRPANPGNASPEETGAPGNYGGFNRGN